MLTIAHLSDTHFGGHPSAAERVRAVLAHIASLGDTVDAVVVTGDIADHGTAEEYAEAWDLLVDTVPLRCPVLVCPGNHDVRSRFAQFLLDQEPDHRAVNAAHRVRNALFLMCDSSVPAHRGELRIDHGELDAQTLDWLDLMLSSRTPRERAIVCLHHPPVRVHVSLMDPIRLVNADALANVLSRHDDVAALLVGHAHTMGATSFAGVPVLFGGAVASTVTLDTEPGAPITHDLPPTLAYHLVDDHGRVMTHFRAVPMP